MTARAYDQRFADIYNDLERFPSIGHVAEEMGLSVKTVKNRAGEMRSLQDAGLDVPDLISRVGTGRGVPLPEVTLEEDTEENMRKFYKRDLIQPISYDTYADKPRYFILSAAQDCSAIHEGFLTNLEAYAKWLGDCVMHIGGFTYAKGQYEDHASESGYYHERVEPYLTNEQIAIGDGLLFLGEMNTLPTAVTPLSGFETYTRDKWGIFPHAKIQLQAVATAKHARTKQLMTTGCVTMPNYVAKKAGIKASFHHQIGAVLVELLADGTFFCRHLQADGLNEDEGGFFDLDRRIAYGKVTTGNRIQAATWGDIHHEKIDPAVAATTWGYGGTIDDQLPLIDYLRPREQFFHDLSDFSARNHHNVKDPHFLFRTYATGTDDVKGALWGCADFLAQTRRPFCKSRVVISNHDNALVKWLKTCDYRDDPANAVFFLEAQSSYYRQLAAHDPAPKIFEQTIKGFDGIKIDDVLFINEDDSHEVCGIECGMHGHLGANGSRGSPRQFARFGKRSNTGHTHSPQIIDGAYVGGVTGSLEQGYNVGASSWAHAHILTYPNGQRAILTMMGNRWYA